MIWWRVILCLFKNCTNLLWLQKNRNLSHLMMPEICFVAILSKLGFLNIYNIVGVWVKWRLKMILSKEINIWNRINIFISHIIIIVKKFKFMWIAYIAVLIDANKFHFKVNVLNVFGRLYHNAYSKGRLFSSKSMADL